MTVFIRRRPWSAVLPVAVAIGLLTGCAPATTDTVTDAPTASRPAVLADYPQVELTAPAATDAGTSPVFAWLPVAGAVRYQLSVVASDGPVWAWSGETTEVRFGGYADEPASGAGAIRLRSAAWWSVTAYAADGALLAVSDLRAVAPDAAAPAPLPHAAAGDDPSPPAVEPLESACPLFSDDEVEEFLEGEPAAPGEGSLEGNGTLSCSWVRADDEFLTFDISVRPGVRRETWDESMETMLEFDPELPHAFEDLGDDSYMDADWGGTRLALIDGDVYLSVRSGFTQGAEEATIAVARLVLERYRERTS